MIDIRRLITASVVCTLIAMTLQGCTDPLKDLYRLHFSSLCEAIVSGNLEHATALFEQGADVNAGGGCALVAAVRSRKVQVVRLLLEKGANPRDNFEAFSIVLNFGDVEMADLLLRHGADANMTYPRGGDVYASMELAPRHWQQVTVPQRDLEPDRIDDTAKHFQCRLSTLFSGGTSLLYLAAGQYGGPNGIGGPGSGSLDQIVKLLLAHGGNPNTKTLNGTTPLMYAASQHNHGIMAMLMDAGADVRATDRCGRMAADYAVLYPQHQRAYLAPQTRALLQRYLGAE